MILVDSSAWIEYLGRGDGPVSQRVQALLDGGYRVCTTGLVVTEVLQRIKSDAAYRKAWKHLTRFPALDLTAEDYELAVDLYRSARKQGITVRSSIDTVLAALCLNRDLEILHCDKDFEHLAELFELRTVIAT